MVIVILHDLVNNDEKTNTLFIVCFSLVLSRIILINYDIIKIDLYGGDKMIGTFLILLVLVVLGVLNNSLTVVTLGLIITLVSYKFKDLYKKAHIFYIIAVIVTVLGIVFYEDYYTRIIQGGLLGYSFILVVMMIGVFPNKYELTRHVKRNRGMLSILGFIFITSHVFLHLFEMIGGVNLFGLIAYVIMIPLTIISFRIIRNEINPKDWFRIQKAAYLVYIALFVHLIMVAGNTDKIIYAVLLTLYANNKVIKEIRK